MTTKQLRVAISARPFKPFTLRNADGGAYRASHPNFVLLAPNAERSFVSHNESSDDAEVYVVLDLPLVSAIEFGNGHARKRHAS